MSHVRARSGFVKLLLAAITLLTSQAFAQPDLTRGQEEALRPKRPITTEGTLRIAPQSIFYSGSFGYSIGGGQAILKADTVSNTNGTATGPLRFSLWFTTSPFPASGTNTASYNITPSLAAGQSINGVNSGGTGVPFTDPPTGCYYVSLVLEENVSGTWTTRDYASFSRSFDIGNACIVSFTAAPQSISSGSTSTLSWTTTGASVTSVSIDNGVGSQSANGSAPVHPTQTTIYTLSAFTTANASPPTKSTTVTVTAAPPPTANLTATPATITAGQSTTLNWSTTNATSTSINNGVGPVASSGSTSVSPAATTTYTLTATGAGGTTTSSATVTVNPAPPTASLTALPASVAPGQSSTLSWSTTGATSVSINNGVGPVASSGSTSVSPTATTTYTLTASGPGGTTTRSATVAVIGTPPTANLSATPSSITGGQSSTLSWSTTNATNISINNGIGPVASSGSTSVSPGVTTTYTLTATGSAGTATSSATVTVTSPLPAICQDPTNVCLNGNRFAVHIDWKTGDGKTGVGAPVKYTGDSGLFWFFGPDNIEVLLKVLDACALNNRYWIFSAATTDVEYTITVSDTKTNQVKTYFHKGGAAAPAITDTDAIKCDATGLTSREEPMAGVWSAVPAVPSGISAVSSSLLPSATAALCADSNVVCLNKSRFAVRIDWKTSDHTGTGAPIKYTADSGLFWFFGPENIEVLLKVLDACALNNRFWIFSAATTDVEYTITVTDTLTGRTKTYFHKGGSAAPAITDTDGMSCS